MYSLIKKADQSEGIDFDHIQQQYTTLGLAKEGFDIPKSKLQPAELQRILMVLQSSRLIVLRNDSRYVIYSEPSFISDPKIAQLESHDIELRQYARRLIPIVQAEDGQYTVSQLTARMQTEFNITASDAIILIGDAISYGHIQVDYEGKVRFSIGQPPSYLIDR